MLQNLFRNIPVITKNLLIINVLFFVATFLMQARGVNLVRILGIHYIDSPFFEPYQMVTHFFMHGGLMHIFFNMFGLVVMGSHLERVWGEKKYLVFYLVTAFGAAILHSLVQGFEVYNLTGSFFPFAADIVSISSDFSSVYSDSVTGGALSTVGGIISTPSVGASGAIYGLILAFAMLFPNTEFMLLFPPIPIKAKWMAVALAGYALYMGFQNSQGDSVAHFAHLGGMLFGYLLLKFWQRDQTSFY